MGKVDEELPHSVVVLGFLLSWKDFQGEEAL
jgi:hypothetical protein